MQNVLYVNALYTIDKYRPTTNIAWYSLCVTKKKNYSMYTIHSVVSIHVPHLFTFYIF